MSAPARPCLPKAAQGTRHALHMEFPAMLKAQNASNEQTRQQTLSLLNQHLAAAVILQDRMRRSSRNVLGANFIMIDDTCEQVVSLMEICTTLIVARLADLGGTANWPALPDFSEGPGPSANAARPLVVMLLNPEPRDTLGQSALDVVMAGN
jgi:hypothetical protein